MNTTWSLAYGSFLTCSLACSSDWQRTSVLSTGPFTSCEAPRHDAACPIPADQLCPVLACHCTDAIKDGIMLCPAVDLPDRQTSGPRRSWAICESGFPSERVGCRTGVPVAQALILRIAASSEALCSARYAIDVVMIQPCVSKLGASRNLHSPAHLFQGVKVGASGSTFHFLDG